MKTSLHFLESADMAVASVLIGRCPICCTEVNEDRVCGSKKGLYQYNGVILLKNITSIPTIRFIIPPI